MKSEQPPPQPPGSTRCLLPCTLRLLAVAQDGQLPFPWLTARLLQGPGSKSCDSPSFEGGGCAETVRSIKPPCAFHFPTVLLRCRGSSLLRPRGYDRLKEVLIQDWFLIPSTSSGPPTMLSTTYKGHPTPPPHPDTSANLHTPQLHTQKLHARTNIHNIHNTDAHLHSFHHLKTPTHSESIYRNCDGEELVTTASITCPSFQGRPGVPRWQGCLREAVSTPGSFRDCRATHSGLTTGHPLSRKACVPRVDGGLAGFLQLRTDSSEREFSGGSTGCAGVWGRDRWVQSCFLLLPSQVLFSKHPVP